MSTAHTAKSIPPDIVEEIQEWERRALFEGGWLRWIWYSIPMRRVDRIPNYLGHAANSLRELGKHCQDQGLAGEIETLRREFESLAENDSWLGMYCPPRWQGRFSVGKLGVFDVSCEGSLLHVQDRVNSMNLEAHKLLMRVLAQESGMRPAGAVEATASPSLACAKKLSKIGMALVHLKQHPDWSVQQIADAVPCNANYLSQSQDFKTARKAIKGLGQENLRRSERHRGREIDGRDRAI